MTDIDALRGHALNCAVATELGWQQDAKHKRWWSDPSGGWSHCILFDDDQRTQTSVMFDPAHDPTDAWTLDGDGWHWSYDEGYAPNKTVNPTWLDMDMCAISQDIEADVTLLFADFASKAEAHATARSIVWLKARGVEQPSLCCKIQSNEVESTGK